MRCVAATSSFTGAARPEERNPAAISASGTAAAAAINSFHRSARCSWRLGSSDTAATCQHGGKNPAESPAVIRRMNTRCSAFPIAISPSRPKPIHVARMSSAPGGHPSPCRRPSMKNPRRIPPEETPAASGRRDAINAIPSAPSTLSSIRATTHSANPPSSGNGIRPEGSDLEASVCRIASGGGTQFSRVVAGSFSAPGIGFPFASKSASRHPPVTAPAFNSSSRAIS